MGVPKLVIEEYDRATSKFGAFNSAHEGYAVIKEEVDELMDELVDVNHYSEYLWDYVKWDNHEQQLKECQELYKYAVRAAEEAVQVAAMAKRFIHDIGRDE